MEASTEVTGHAHAIQSEKAALFRDPKLAAVFMAVTEEPVELVHDEHDTITIPPGNYRVIRQREYTSINPYALGFNPRVVSFAKTGVGVHRGSSRSC